MVFCSKCGSKLMGNELFCSVCGSKLNDISLIDKTISYEKATEKPGDIFSEITPVKARNSISISDIIKLMLATPITSINRLVHRIDKKGILILALVLATVQGFFTIWSFKLVLSTIDKTFSNFLSDFSDVSLSNIGNSLEIPYARIFFHGVILYFIIIIVLYLGIYFIFNGIHKTQVPSFKIIKANILSTIQVLSCELLFLLFSYINTTLAFIVLLAGVLVFFSALLHSLRKLMKISDNVVLYNVAAIFSVMLICFLFSSLRFTLLNIESLNLPNFIRH